MDLSRLYLITDRSQTLGRPLIDIVRAALDGGVMMIQLREKDLSGRELFSLAKELRELTNRYNAKLLVNDRVDIALAVGADGVHLGQKSMSVKDARRAFEISSLLIGASTHSLKEALEAEAGGADFITFGPVYHTPSKSAYGGPVGIDKLKEAVEAVNIPVFALGGVKRDNIGDVLSTGAYGAAMISAVTASGDVKKAAEDLLRRIADY